MPNKYHNQGANPSSQSGGEGGSNKASGSSPRLSMPIKTANWPGLPGKSGPDRSGGTPNYGYAGRFYALQQFSPRQIGKPTLDGGDNPDAIQARKELKAIQDSEKEKSKGPAYGFEGMTVREILDESNARNARIKSIKKRMK